MDVIPTYDTVIHSIRHDNTFEYIFGELNVVVCFMVELVGYNLS